MGFYDIPDNVNQYIDMCNEYDGSHIYREIKKYIKEGISVLELGSGPGLDIPFLDKHYEVTGSDLSKEFILRLVKKYPEITFIRINAVDLGISDIFDCIYSNKVLHHLTKEELEISLKNQRKILSPKGIIAHTFWIGEESEEIEDLLFTYYKKEEIVEIISKEFNVLSVMSYNEFEEADSLLIIAEKR